MFDIQKIEPGKTLLITGDSVTDCGRSYPYADYLSNMGTGYPWYIHNMVTAVYPQKRLHVVNAGISGQTSRDIKARWDNDLKAVKPDYATLLIGVNDVWRRYDAFLTPECAVPEDEFEENLYYIAKDAKEKLEGFTLISPFLFENNKRDQFFSTVLAYADICERVAKDVGVNHFSFQKEIYKALGSLNTTALSPDRVHPNPVGHVLLTRALLKEWNFKF